MISINIPEIELTKPRRKKSFWILKPILKRNFNNNFKEGAIIKRKGTNDTFRIQSIKTFKNIKEALETTDYNIFNAGNSEEEVLNYYKSLYSKSFSKNWITLSLKLIQVQ